MDPKYCITLDEARERVAVWLDDQERITKEVDGRMAVAQMPILRSKSFVFRAEEILVIAEMIRTYNDNHPEPEEQVNAMRFYLGIKAHSDGLDGMITPSLIAVGVKNFHPDNSNGGDDILDMGSEDESPTIFDFSYPCPATCPRFSIMEVTPGEVSNATAESSSH